MLHRLGSLFSRFSQRFLPDPMVIACGLTLLVILAALILPQTDTLRGANPTARVRAVSGMWLDGVWNPNFLRFALQMCLILLTGHALARAPAATALLRRVAGTVTSNRSAVFRVTLLSCAGCWINWGFGLIAAGILAAELNRALARKGIAGQSALIVAGAYAGMMIWHGGLSGSAPLELAGHGITIQTPAGEAPGTVALPPVAIDRTLLSPGNLFLSLILVAAVPLLFRHLAYPLGTHLSPQTEERPGSPPPPIARTPADAVNQSRAIPLLIVLLGAVALAYRLDGGGARVVDLNFVITVFLLLGLLLHRNLRDYVAAVAGGGRSVTGIILQFPLYSGIQAILFESGWAAAMSETFVEASISTAEFLRLSPGATFPVATFFSAGLVNLFVPSGGGQWIVQGPIMCGASEALRLPVEQTVMAVAYGDEWTNMIQPFWAIPLIGLTGVDARAFIGYCALLMLMATPVFILSLLLLY